MFDKPTPVLRWQSGGRFETLASYSRARRVGAFIWVAGTTAIEPSGRLHAPGDAYAQTLYIIKRIDEALAAVGGKRHHIVRTTAFLANMQTGGQGFIRAHGEAFAGTQPAMSAVEAGLTMPGMEVEILADAIIHEIQDMQDVTTTDYPRW